MLKESSRRLMILFRQKIYKLIRKIPAGEILSYKKVAQLAGRPKAWRAVGNALNKNTSAEIPCHRVIRSDGLLGGYKQGGDKKAFLLKQEGVKII